jgi:hypothetical protein
VTIRSPQIAPVHGALDSAAITDGGSFSAHHHRAMVRNANRYASKGRVEASVWYPEHDTVRDGESAGVWHFAGGYAPTNWTRWASFPMAKVPSHATAQARWTLRVTNTAKVDVQHATRGRRFSRTPTDVMTVTGTGAYAHSDADAIPLAPGNSETVDVWVRSISRGPLMATGTFGTPNTVSSGFILTASALYVSSATTWVAAPNRTIAQAGHALYFLDADGNTLASREITNDTATTPHHIVEFFPAFNATDLAVVRGRLDSVEIRKLPDFDVSCLAFRTEDMTR